MLQSAAVWRLTHTADRIIKSKYENRCCSPEPSAKSTGPGSGQESLFRGEVDSDVEWLTVILLGKLHMDMITHCDRDFEHAMYTKCETKVAALEFSWELSNNLKTHDCKVRRWTDGLFWIIAGGAGLFWRPKVVLSGAHWTIYIILLTCRLA